MGWVWFREVVQNSIDAGATEIDIVTDENEKVISCIDNGRGMNAKIFLNKFLALGGSYKEDDAVGGFGQAKEIVILTWPGWMVLTKKKGANEVIKMTREMYLAQQGIDDAFPGGFPDRPFNKTEGHGTEVSITYDDDRWDLEEFVDDGIEWIGTCKFRSNLKIRVNGTEYQQIAGYHRGRKIDDVGWAEIYYNKTEQSGYGNIRLKGLCMYQTYLGVPGTVTVELQGESVDVLGDNRDELNWEYKSELQRIANAFISDPVRATREKEPVTTLEMGGQMNVNFADPNFVTNTRDMIDETAQRKKRDELAEEATDEDEIIKVMPPASADVGNKGELYYRPIYEKPEGDITPEKMEEKRQEKIDEAIEHELESSFMTKSKTDNEDEEQAKTVYLNTEAYAGAEYQGEAKQRIEEGDHETWDRISDIKEQIQKEREMRRIEKREELRQQFGYASPFLDPRIRYTVKCDNKNRYQGMRPYSKRMQKMAMYWKETVIAVINAAQYAPKLEAVKHDVCTGFIFERNVQGEFQVLKEGPYLISMNPRELIGTGTSSLSKLFPKILSTAIHEVVHIFVNEHNNNFIQAYQAIQIEVMKRYKEIERQVRRNVMNIPAFSGRDNPEEDW